MEIKSLDGVGFDELAEAFARAFADYDTQWSPEELQKMLRRRGFDPALSFAAYDAGEIVAFTFNGTGRHGGRTTAYDTGTGTVARYRGQGLATRIFEHAVPRLKAAGVERYLLEVLRHNAPAVAVYRKLGFETTRLFNYARTDRRRLVRRLESAAAPCTLRPATLEELADTGIFRDFAPSWQNSFASAARAADDVRITGAYDGGQLAGYCIADPASGDVAQIAVAPRCRRRGIASQLLRQAAERCTGETMGFINTEAGCASIDGFLAALGIEPQGQQLEMVKEL